MGCLRVNALLAFSIALALVEAAVCNSRSHGIGSISGIISGCNCSSISFSARVVLLGLIRVFWFLFVDIFMTYLH